MGVPKIIETGTEWRQRVQMRRWDHCSLACLLVCLFLQNTGFKSHFKMILCCGQDIWSLYNSSVACVIWIVTIINWSTLEVFVLNTTGYFRFVLMICPNHIITLSPNSIPFIADCCSRQNLWATSVSWQWNCFAYKPSWQTDHRQTHSYNLFSCNHLYLNFAKNYFTYMFPLMPINHCLSSSLHPVH